MSHRRFAISFFIVLALFSLFAGPVRADNEKFPVYPVIEPNVAFWTQIYACYSTTQAVVHDSLHLDIVYEVIDLKPMDEAGARKINRKRMKQASQRIADILKRLAADPRAADADCRRVAALFGSKADAGTFARARRRVRCQIGQMDRFQAGVIRSGAYLDQMQAILRSNGVPEDLAYLPHVESSFNAHAYSKFGAAGMWQFTRSTGKRFLTVDYVLDERRDPIAATRAAALLLRENYEKLGNWPLAITAYNHGAAGMQRARANHAGYPEIFTSYKGRTFKFASRNFYSEFLAARQVASNYRRYFGEMVLAPPRSARPVKITGFAAFDDLCRHFKVSPEVARSMNPALRPPVFSGQKYVPEGYVFNLPANSPPGVAMLAKAPADLFKTAQKPSQFYTVCRGDTAGKIARMHRVKLNDLILANGLDRRATVYVRQRLRIPQKGESVVRVAEKRAVDPMDSKTQPASAAKIETVAALLPNVPVESAERRYRRPEPAPADLLAMAEEINENASREASVQESPVNPGIALIDMGFDRIDHSDRQPVGIIRVEVEETLGHYAEWAGVRASSIRRLNGLSYGRPLQLNQQVKIPLNNVTEDDFETRRYEFHKRLQEDFFAAYRIGELQRYQVRPGDSYWTLCREKFDLPLWLLKQYNTDINLAALKVHQSLTIPSVESVAANDPDLMETASAAPDA
ncbi:transglycosylase SLT domain-containing protein [uncultured Desulfosarcina sp.]|uniref:transglycosylase SLT domain-containing protein n=1 Tax=uncultured Desulfosarcina sp. TaxID=218289 RepID=UPI0029C8A928|nr:transglycosylase SLT domain-containing protein [uncultured Desulfosarcina sp.]